MLFAEQERSRSVSDSARYVCRVCLLQYNIDKLHGQIAFVYHLACDALSHGLDRRQGHNNRIEYGFHIVDFMISCCKDNANELDVSLPTDCRMQLFLCKVTVFLYF